MARRPQLLLTREPRVVRVHLPNFPVHVSNISGADAVRCRYCRYQRLFVKDRDEPTGQRTFERFYATRYFDLAAHQSAERMAEECGNDAWVRSVLQDVIAGEQASVLLYEDRSGVKFRLRPRQGVIDVWRPRHPFISRLLRRHPPPVWTLSDDE